jgi:hypothetical protein
MAMPAHDPFAADTDLEALRRENETLRQQVRQLSAGQTVARGALQAASSEKEATARIAHQAVVEERATRAAVEVTASTATTVMVLQVMNLLVSILLLVGLFLWLPKALAQPSAPTVITSPSGATVIPAR